MAGGKRAPVYAGSCRAVVEHPVPEQFLVPTHLLLKGSTPWVLNRFYDPPENGLKVLSAGGASTIEVSDFILTPELIEQIKQLGLRLIVQAYPQVAEDIVPVLEMANSIRAIAINCHIKAPHVDHSTAVEIVRGLQSRAADAGVPLYCETHRGCITQDLYRTAKLAEAVPELKFTLDVSHYIICEEQTGPTPLLAPLLEPILERTEMMHGRISNGQQIQVDVENADASLVKSYRLFWTEAMRRWRRRKPAGSSLIFTPELGPPPYGIVGPDGNELINRLDQSELIWNIAQQAWKDSATAGKEPVWPAD